VSPREHDDDLAAAADDARTQALDDHLEVTLSVHPRDVEMYQRMFPHIDVIPSVYVVEGDLRDLFTEPGWQPEPKDLA
jgi:transcriptional regulator GlxA family with amidase domain